MKSRLSILSGLLFLSLVTFSQKVNLVVFSEDGYKFYAFVNGIKQNDVAESNVKITGVTPNISLRVEFEDKALPQLKQNMALEAGFEHTAKITRDMKKQLKLRYFGQVALNDASSGNVPTVAYHTAENTNTTNYNTSTSDNGNASYTTTSTTQVNTNTAANPNGAAVNINIDGMSMNMNVSGMDMNGTTTTYSSSSTTVTSSSSSSNSSPKHNNNHQQATVGESQNVSVGSAGCKAAMPAASFDKMKQSVEAKPFSDTKMSTAKVATKNNCISVSQIKEICKLFSMDDDKLTYAKFAYDYCVDKGNYYLVSDVFSFSSTTDELNKFIEEH
jgi:hypothetical protein